MSRIDSGRSLPPIGSPSSHDELDLEEGSTTARLELSEGEDESEMDLDDDDEDVYAPNGQSMDSPSDERSPMLQRLNDDASSRQTDSPDWREEPGKKIGGRMGDDAVPDWLAAYEEQDEIDEMDDELNSRRLHGGYGHARTPSATDSKDGTRGVVEVAWEVASACLPGAPLLIPHSFYLTGLGLGLPMLFGIALASWFSHVILAMEARYVGGSSYPHLAASVFPRRWGGRWFGEALVDVWCIIASVGRAIVVLGLSTQLVRARDA